MAFNRSAGLSAIVATLNDRDASNDRLRLTRFDLNGGNGVAVKRSGKARVFGQSIALDFGAAGLSDGYYEIALDVDGDKSFEAVRHFYRLLGDVNGDRIVDDLDLAAIAAAVGRKGAGLDADANGDGLVSAKDQVLAAAAKGRRLAAGLGLDA
jgi:hypothetical protein